MHLGLSCDIVVLRQQIQENRLIAPHKIRKTAHRFRYNLLQHHIADIVDVASSTPGIVVGTAVKLLIELQAFGSAKMQLSPAVRAIQQSCKQALSSRFRVPALVAAQLLHPVKQFF